jgi:chromosome segregation ATPase
MRTPTEYEIEAVFLAHYAEGYDPIAAKKYYEEHKHLKGRKRGTAQVSTSPRRSGSSTDPRTGKTQEQIHRDARARQRQELTDLISSLSKRLTRLEGLIKERETEERQANSKSKAKKERAAKEKDKPKTAAEKAEAARDAEKYRDKNQQKLKNKSDDKKSGGSSGSKKKGTGKHTSSELRSMATKVRGQIAVYKQKLAAL